MKIIAKREYDRAMRLSFESRHLVLQILPNFYAQVGPFDLAIDRNGFLLCHPYGHCGFIRGCGFHGGRCGK